MAEPRITRALRLREQLSDTLSAHWNELCSILSMYVNQGKTVLQPHQLLAEFESAVVKDAKTLKGGEFEDILKATQVIDNNLHIDSGNLYRLNGEDDELGNKPGHEYLDIVDIEYSIEAEPEIHETEVDDQNIETPNEGNGESVAVPGPDQHIDIENQEVAEQRSVNNSDVEEGPTNGDLAARVKLGSKIGILAASTSLAGTIPIFSNSGNHHEKNLYDKLLLGVSLLFILASFVFGVTLVQGHPFFHLEIFPINNPRSITRIKFVTGAAIVSITMVMIFGIALVIRRVY